MRRDASGHARRTTRRPSLHAGMTTRVGFLRAVNVGKRTVPMATLREVVEGLGYEHVFKTKLPA